MRFCKTTLWIKKSVLRNNELTLTSFGPFWPKLRELDRFAERKRAENDRPDHFATWL